MTSLFANVLVSRRRWRAMVVEGMDGWLGGGSAPQNGGLGLFFVGVIASDRSSIKYGG